MSKEKLLESYNKYVKNNYFYRVVSEEYEKDILKKGLNPSINPFESKKKDIFSLFKLVLKLKKEGFIMMRIWSRPVDQEHIVNVTKKDLKQNFVDFTPDYKDTLSFYKDLKGGALANTVFIFTEELLLKQIGLTKKEKELVLRLNKWSKDKINTKNVVFKIKASSKYLEKAKLQDPKLKDYLPSPFGSFEHFEKVVQKHCLETYIPYLKQQKLFYLRTKTKIAPEELKKIKK